MKSTLNVGFITTVSGRWPRETPQKRMERYGAFLNEKLSQVNLITFDTLIDSTERIDNAIDTLRKKGVDLVIMLYGAFTGDDVCTGIADSLNVPLILWAPREPELGGGRLLSNALVALTMNSASMHRLGHACYPVYGNLEEPEAVSKVLSVVNAYAVVKKMRHTVLGLFGYRPTAFYNSAFDEGLIRRTFGIRMEETDLKTVFDEMEKTDPQELEKDQRLVRDTFSTVDPLPKEYKENHSKLYLALKNLVQREGYDYCAIKCWPEMGNLKTTPCAVLGRLADANINIACEGDVDAALAMIAQNSITGHANFITDMIDLHEKENTLTFWHCGNAAPSLHHPDYPTKMGDHPLAGQGTAFYTALKEGPVTISRFCNIDGAYKLFLIRGTASKTDLYTPGCMINVVPDAPVSRIMDAIMKNGVPHHYSIVWDDVADIMTQVAEILGIEIIKY